MTIDLTLFELVYFKYKLARHIADMPAEFLPDRIKACRVLLRTLDEAGLDYPISVELSQPQVLRLAYFVLDEMDWATDFDEQHWRYVMYYDMLVKLGVADQGWVPVAELTNDSDNWLIPKLPKRLLRKTRKQQHK
jgi:hypothetical protein